MSFFLNFRSSCPITEPIDLNFDVGTYLKIEVTPPPLSKEEASLAPEKHTFFAKVTGSGSDYAGRTLILTPLTRFNPLDGRPPSYAIDVTSRKLEDRYSVGFWNGTTAKIMVFTKEQLAAQRQKAPQEEKNSQNS